MYVYCVYHAVSKGIKQPQNFTVKSRNRCHSNYFHRCPSCISDLMVGMLVSSAVEHAFDPRSGHTNDYEIGICCSSAKSAALRSKSKD